MNSKRHIVNHEPSLNIPVGTDEFCVVGQFGAY